MPPVWSEYFGHQPGDGSGDVFFHFDPLRADPGIDFIGIDKAEVTPRRGPWRSAMAVECATPEWVDRFNNRRLLEPVGSIPPAEAGDSFHAAPATEPIAA